jgi:hypothetical protein
MINYSFKKILFENIYIMINGWLLILAILGLYISENTSCYHFLIKKR